jgi:predicted transcriptional regulator
LPISNRIRVIQAASISPGIHLRELARMLGLSLHAVRYHVESLSKSGLILCERKDGYSRIFPIGTPEADMIVYSLLRNNSARKAISALSSSQSLTNKEICEKTGLAKSTVSETVQAFIENHVAHIELSDNGVKITLLDPQRIAKLLREYELAKDSTVVDNFIDLWDF